MNKQTTLLPDHFNRWAALGAGALTLALVLMNLVAPDLDDIFFATIEIATLLYIVWVAWHWSAPGRRASKKRKDPLEEYA